VKTNAAICWEVNADWSVEEIDIDPPQEGEVLVSFEASGLCYSDEHIRNGDLAGAPLPMVGGHEGAGIVRELGRRARAQSRRSRRRIVPASVWSLPLVCER
jgi:Zn-dependent alcohol dehydrogenase